MIHGKLVAPSEALYIVKLLPQLVALTSLIFGHRKLAGRSCLILMYLKLFCAMRSSINA